jgi:GMP synthase (glutamine-hydrolysing)
MSLLVLRHEAFEHLGLFARTLAAQGISFDYLDLERHMPEHMTITNYEGIVIMGGPMSANDTLPGLAKELRIIEQALERNMPMLGICLGSQLIAKASGARVYRNAALEIGWEAVHFTEAGQRDPLFCGIAAATRFFHWHGETFDLPQGAEWLAWSEKCRHQAYRLGSNVYGLQFHPEVSAEMIEEWWTQPVNCGDVATMAHPVDPHALDQSEVANRIMLNWLSIAGI